MSRIRSKPNQFIIQNFRSWAGKNYVSLNQVNFLFGGNSSGKSSILAAISLLKQSVKEGDFRLPIPLRLLGSGSDIQLGPIDKQASAIRTDWKAKPWYEEAIGFGIKFNEPNRIADILEGSFGYDFEDEDEEARVNAQQKNWSEFFSKNFKSIELITYYDEKNGEIIGYEVNIDRFTFIRVFWPDDGRDLQVSICDDEKFWKTIYNYNKSDRFEPESLISALTAREYALNEALSGAWAAYRRQLDKFYHDRARGFMVADDLEDATKKLKTDPNNEHLKRRVTRLEQMLKEINHGVRDRINVDDSYTYSDDPYERKLAQEMNIPFQRMFDWGDFANFINDIKKHSNLNLKRPTSLPGFKSSKLNQVLLFSQASEVPEQHYAWPQNSNMDMLSLLFLAVFPDNFNVSHFVPNIMRKYALTFQSIVQIGPHREMPNRVGVIDAYKEVESVGKSAENLLNLMYQNAKKRNSIKAINDWLKKLEIGYTLKISYNSEFSVLKLTLIDDDGLEVQLNDVGYGISQILPIVVQTVLSENTFLTIEQPELHIHPRLQANLADLFIWSASERNNKFMIETHSEHLILRLQRRQRETNQENDNESNKSHKNGAWEGIPKSISISIVEKEHQSKISEIQINSKGNFTGQWPGGFFEERFVEKGLI